jgi:diguanylate cyclase (GGDEF)-like protein/PAS domain S-box-containing protein
MSISTDGLSQQAVDHPSSGDITFEHSPDAIVHLTADGRVKRLNSAAHTLVYAAGGSTRNGLTVQDVSQALYPIDITPLLAYVMDTSTSRRVESRHLRDDETYWLETWIVPHHDQDSRGTITFGRDITHLKQTEERLRLEANRDPLTGLLNHAAFHAEVAEGLQLRESTGGLVALILVDLDYLKLTNDVYGHQLGDQALCAVAAALSQATRASDRVARLGGDEFGCVLFDTDSDAVLRVAERIRQGITDTVLAPAGRLSASIGVALIASTYEPGDLFDRADNAVYDAKARGRGIVVMTDPTDIAYTSRRNIRTELVLPDPVDLTTATDIPSLCRAALREWVHVLAASGGCIDLLDEAGETVKAEAYYRFGHDDWVLAQQCYGLDEYPNTAYAIEHRQTYTCRVDDPDADPAEVDLLRERGFASLLLTPLVANGRPLGIVELFDTRHRPFTTDDQRLALSLASHFAALLMMHQAGARS